MVPSFQCLAFGLGFYLLWHHPPHYKGWCKERCSLISAYNASFDYNTSNDALVNDIGTLNGEGSGGNGICKSDLIIPFQNKMQMFWSIFRTASRKNLNFDNYFGIDINVTADHDQVNRQCVTWIHSQFQQFTDQKSGICIKNFSGGQGMQNWKLCMGF